MLIDVNDVGLGHRTKQTWNVDGLPKHSLPLPLPGPLELDASIGPASRSMFGGADTQPLFVPAADPHW